jgi:hypothetical protein
MINTATTPSPDTGRTYLFEGLFFSLTLSGFLQLLKYTDMVSVCVCVCVHTRVRTCLSVCMHAYVCSCVSSVSSMNLRNIQNNISFIGYPVMLWHSINYRCYVILS